MKRSLECLFFVLIIVCLSSRIFAQPGNARPLQIGDTVPEMIFDSMLNYARGKAKLSDFKGKPVILDLWHVGCSACIAGFPKMQELQKKFGDKIQIVAATFSTMSEFNMLRQRSKIIPKINALPFAVGFTWGGKKDTVIRKLFSNNFYPAHIWIDKNGILRAMTRSDNATEENINRFISNEAVDFINYFSWQSVEFDRDTSLLCEGSGRHLSQVSSTSVFMNRSKDFPSFVKSLEVIVDGRTKYRGIRMFNMPSYRFLSYAYNCSSLPIFFETDDLMTRFVIPAEAGSKDSWYQNNTFSFEFMLPRHQWVDGLDELKLSCRLDIERFFEVKGEKKLVKTRCLELHTTKNVNKSVKAGQTSSRELTFKGISFHDYFMKDFVKELEGRLNFESGSAFVPVIDKTDYEGHVDLEFSSALELKNLKAIRADLNKHGFELKESVTEIEGLFVSKRK